MFSCPNCSHEMRLSIEKQLLECPACMSEFTPQEYNKSKSRKAEEYQESTGEDDSSMAVIVYRCPQCGGELVTEDDTAATFCSYCGSSVMLEKRIVEQMKPAYIIPFKITKEECEKIYRKEIEGKRFVQDDLKNDTIIEKFRAIYIPYYRYSYSVKDATYKGVGQYSFVRGNYNVTKHYDVNIKCSGKVNDAMFDASSSFADELAMKISPYNLEEIEKFNPAFLSGFYADTNDVASQVYEQEAHKAGDMALLRTVKTTDSYQNEVKANVDNFNKFNLFVKHEDITMEDLKTETILLPVWFMAIRSKNKKRVSYAVINGQTGKITTELPISIWKVFGLVGILTVGLFILFGLLFQFSYSTSLVISMIVALLVSFGAKATNDDFKAREVGADDKGFMSKQQAWDNPTEFKAMQKKKMKKVKSGIWHRLPLFGILLGIVMFILYVINDEVSHFGFVSDVYYYGTSIIICVLIAITLIQIICKNNFLVTRKLPQFNKRGGDE